MQRLGKNKGGYFGERIDIAAVLERTHQLACASGWIPDEFFSIGAIPLRAYRRPVSTARKNLYISAGIHGDEPSGPATVLRMFEENAWPEDGNLWVVPCLNPHGFQENTRENSERIDLNRDYRHQRSREVQAHVRWLDQQPPFNFSFILHEDWESNGFYVYELNPEHRPSLADALVGAVQEVCLIEPAELVDGWDCKAGIIRPQVQPEDRPEWAEAIYLITHNSRQSYTLETPSDYPLELRVDAHLRALQTGMRLGLARPD